MSFCKNADDTWKQLLVPTLAGAAGTGAASGLLSSRNHDPDETPSQRRRRIIRSALLGAGVGGVAGAAIPAGVKLLNERINPAPVSPMHAIGDKLREHPAITGAVGAGLTAGGVALGRGRVPGSLLKNINELLKGTESAGVTGAAGLALSHSGPTLASAVKNPTALAALKQRLETGLVNKGLDADSAAMQATELLRHVGAPHSLTTGAATLAPEIKKTMEGGNWAEKWLAGKMMQGTPKVPGGPNERTWVDKAVQHYRGLATPTLAGGFRSHNLIRPFTSPVGSTLGAAALGAGAGNIAGEVIPGVGDN